MNMQKQEREKVNHLKQIMSLCSVCIHSLRKDPVFVENVITIKIIITKKKQTYWHYTNQIYLKVHYFLGILFTSVCVCECV